MPTDEEFYAARDHAVEQLLPLPGVTGVGIGGRERDGEPLDEIVLRVYVEIKKPPEEIPPDQLIPDEINGIPTDVAEMGRGRLLQAPEKPGKPEIPLEQLEKKNRRPLRGGTRIQSDLFGASSGTLGCFLEDPADPSKVYALTNWHVLQGTNEDPAKGRTKAGHPTGDSGCSGCCSDLIGTVMGGGMDSARDAGVTRLDSGTEWLAEIFEVGPVRGSHSITPAEAGATPRYQVRKREAMNSVPENWTPFVPVHLPGDLRAIRLQRAAMLSVVDGRPVRPRTAVLREGLDSTPKTSYFISEEEVPQTSTRVTVAYNRTRWRNGRVALWLSTQRGTGRGEGSSGLAFDFLVDTPPKP